MPRVRVIGSDGEMIGVLSRDEALAKAEDEGLDKSQHNEVINSEVADLSTRKKTGTHG